jgi:cathepsin D
MEADPFFTTAFKQGAVSSNEFGFYLNTSGSELFLGGTNPSHYTGGIEYHAVNSSSGFWQISGGSASVDGTRTNSGFHAIIDSGTSIAGIPFCCCVAELYKQGTTIMYGPPSAVKAFYAHVPHSKPFDPVYGFYSFPCNSVPAVSFSWGGKDWRISPDK